MQSIEAVQRGARGQPSPLHPCSRLLVYFFIHLSAHTLRSSARISLCSAPLCSALHASPSSSSSSRRRVGSRGKRLTAGQIRPPDSLAVQFVPTAAAPAVAPTSLHCSPPTQLNSLRSNRARKARAAVIHRRRCQRDARLIVRWPAQPAAHSNSIRPPAPAAMIRRLVQGLQRVQVRAARTVQSRCLSTTTSTGAAPAAAATPTAQSAPSQPLHLRSSLQLRSGNCMPMIGLGTWRAEPGQVGASVVNALEQGYRHIDSAAVYENEAELGHAVNEWISSTGEKVTLAHRHTAHQRSML